MCKEGSEPTSTAVEDVMATEDDKAIDPETDSSDDSKESDELILRDWRCREKKHVKNGNDLGVWESSLEDRSSFYNVWMLGYLTPLLRLGSSKVLDYNDIGVPSKEDLADHAYTTSKQAWEVQDIKLKAMNEKLKTEYEAKLAKCKNEEQRTKVKTPKYKEPSISYALLEGFGKWAVAVAIFYQIVAALLSFVPVIILNDLVKFFESGDSISEYKGYAPPWVEVAGLAVVPFIMSLLTTRSTTIMAHTAVFVRTAVSTMLYRKALRVSGAGKAMTSTGQVVNMMSNDTAQLQRFLQFGGLIITAPITVVIALVLIYQQVCFDNMFRY
jgi:hypothetical protein